MTTSSHPTKLQQYGLENSEVTTVDSTSKFLGLAFIVAGAIFLTANMRVGIFFRSPGILLCGGGIFLLWKQGHKSKLGWLLIALGMAVIIFTSNMFASINLLTLIISSALLFAGYQLFSTGKIFGYSWRSLKNLIKK